MPEEMFKRFYDEIQPKIAYSVRRVVSDEEQANDLVEDLMVLFAANLKSVELIDRARPADQSIKS